MRAPDKKKKKRSITSTILNTENLPHSLALICPAYTYAFTTKILRKKKKNWGEKVTSGYFYTVIQQQTKKLGEERENVHNREIIFHGSDKSNRDSNQFIDFDELSSDFYI